MKSRLNVFIQNTPRVHRVVCCLQLHLIRHPCWHSFCSTFDELFPSPPQWRLSFVLGWPLDLSANRRGEFFNIVVFWISFDYPLNSDGLNAWQFPLVFSDLLNFSSFPRRSSFVWSYLDNYVPIKPNKNLVVVVGVFSDYFFVSFSREQRNTTFISLFHLPWLQ